MIQLPRATESLVPAMVMLCLNEGGNSLIFLGADQITVGLILSDGDSTHRWRRSVRIQHEDYRVEIKGNFIIY